jgi:hypothetical protein
VNILSESEELRLRMGTYDLGFSTSQEIVDEFLKLFEVVKEDEE